MLTCSILLAVNSATAQETTKLPPEATEFYTPVTPVVKPGTSTTTAPADAIILFDGKDLSAWNSEKESQEPSWKVENGELTVNPGTGGIQTKQDFGDRKLHLEW